jgi:hypothetical protein
MPRSFPGQRRRWGLFFRFLLQSRYKYGAIDSTKQTLEVHRKSSHKRRSIRHEDDGGVSHILPEVRCAGRYPPGVCRCRLTNTEFGRPMQKVGHPRGARKIVGRGFLTPWEYRMPIVGSVHHKPSLFCESFTSCALERYHNLDGFAFIHRPISPGSTINIGDQVEYSAWLDPPARTSGMRSFIYARTGAGPPLIVTLL